MVERDVGGGWTMREDDTSGDPWLYKPTTAVVITSDLDKTPMRSGNVAVDQEAERVPPEAMQALREAYERYQSRQAATPQGSATSEGKERR